MQIEVQSYDDTMSLYDCEVISVEKELVQLYYKGEPRFFDLESGEICDHKITSFTEIIPQITKEDLKFLSILRR